jgi:hypothetical protein
MQAPGGDYSSTDQYQFLNTLSEGCPAGHHFIVSLKVEGRGFPSWTWDGKPLPPGPWYFYTGASDKPRRRQAEDTHAVRAIVVDDVGSKVERSRILAEPTWVLETSPGNFQLGYMLREWTADIPAADALNAGLIAAGLQDKGASPACRLFRLPGSINNKKDRDNFAAVLHSFDKNTVYTLQELAEALKVKPGKVVKPRERPEMPPAMGEDDPVFDWLAANGHVVGKRNAAGWWPIACPFAEEHTADPRTEAKYLQRGDSDTGIGIVYCEHGHGQGANRPLYTQRFFDWVEAQGGPVNRRGGYVISEETRLVLCEIIEVMAARKAAPSPPPPPRAFEARPPRAKPPLLLPRPAHPDPYNFITLRQAIGLIDIGKLANLENTADGKTKAIQPTSAENVESGLQMLEVRPGST